MVTACVFLWARGHLCFIQLAHITFYPYDLLPKFHFHLSGIQLDWTWRENTSAYLAIFFLVEAILIGFGPLVEENFKKFQEIRKNYDHF